MSDWNESRERVNAELERLDKSVNRLAGELQNHTIKTVEQFSDQTKQLSALMGNVKTEITGSLNKLTMEVVAIKAKAAVWGVLAGAIGTAMLRWLLK